MVTANRGRRTPHAVGWPSIPAPIPVHSGPVSPSPLPCLVPGPVLASSQGPIDYWSMLFVLLLATFVGLGVIARVSRLLHTPLMSLTNAISAIAIVGSIMVTGGEHSLGMRLVGAVAIAASTINIVSGFLITDRMLKLFKQRNAEGGGGGKGHGSPAGSGGAASSSAGTSASTSASTSAGSAAR